MRFLKILWPSYNIWTLIGSLSFRNLSSCSRSKQESFLSSSQHHFLVFSHISQILLLFKSAAFWSWWDSSLKKMSTVSTPSNSEIICGQNVGKKVVCGMILFSKKKAMLKIWKKSWVPFRSYLLNSTANPAHLHSNFQHSFLFKK